MTTTLPTSPGLPEQLPLAEPGTYGDPERNGLTGADLLDGITEHLFYTLGRRAVGASRHDLYMALSYAVRDRLMTRHLAFKDAVREHQPRAVAYLSAEFLIGPQLGNNLLMLGIREQASEALRSSASTTSRRSSAWRRSRAWATAAWAGWPPAFWNRSPPWRSRPPATASATNSASSTS